MSPRAQEHAQEPQVALHCRSCQKLLRREPVSRVFPAYHARCIERAVALARAETRPD